MSKPILVPLDGSELAEQALELAVPVAKRLDAPLHLVRVPLWPPDSPLTDVAEVQGYLQKMAGRVSEELGSSVSTAILPEKPSAGDGSWPASGGSIADLVLDYATRQGTELVAIATHGRGGLARAWFGSVADALVRRARIPLLVVRPEEGDHPVRDIRHVLLPLDATATAAQPAIAPAARIARAFGARVTLLRVIPWPYQVYTAFTPATVVAVGEDIEALRRSANEALEKIAAGLRGDRLQVDVAVTEHVNPGRAIDEWASEHGVDLIALATNDRRGFDRLVLGSVADKVVRGADCPVLVLRIGDEEA